MKKETSASLDLRARTRLPSGPTRQSSTKEPKDQKGLGDRQAHPEELETKDLVETEYAGNYVLIDFYTNVWQLSFFVILWNFSTNKNEAKKKNLLDLDLFLN